LQPEVRATVRRHLAVLLLAAAVVALSLALSVQPCGRVGLGSDPEVLIPPLCASRTVFNFNCPGCGLTRSFVHLAHGQWNAAWEMHRLGWLLAVVTLLQFPYRIYGLMRPGEALVGPTVVSWMGYALLVLMVGNWIVGMFLAFWS